MDCSERENAGRFGPYSHRTKYGQITATPSTGNIIRDGGLPSSVACLVYAAMVMFSRRWL